MHYSQKKRYYFFIAIVKFKTILSYSLAQACSLCLAAYPSLILRSTFAQGSLKVRSPLAQAYSLCPIQNSLAAYPSSHTRLRQLANFPSLILRSTFAYPSLILRSTFAQGSMRRILNFELMGLLGLVGLL